jgi:hypothetical protein
MKKIFLYGITVLAIGLLAAVNVTLGNGKKTLNDLQLSNVEALAEDGEVKTQKYYNVVSCTCSNGKSGYTFGCTTTPSSETCTSPFSNCYKVSGTLSWPPINVQTCGAYAGS